MIDFEKKGFEKAINVLEKQKKEMWMSLQLEDGLSDIAKNNLMTIAGVSVAIYTLKEELKKSND